MPSDHESAHVRNYIPQIANPVHLRSPSLEIQDDIDPSGDHDEESEDDDFPGLVRVDDSNDEDDRPGLERPPAQEDPYSSVASPVVEPQQLPEEPNPPLKEPRDNWCRGTVLGQTVCHSILGTCWIPPTTNTPKRFRAATFTSRVDWEIAKWAKLRGSTSKAFTDLLSIDGINQVIDTSRELPEGRPTFARQEIVVGDEAFDVYFRPIVECLKALDADKTVRFYADMHTAEWWWQTQETLERRQPGATIIPVMISTPQQGRIPGVYDHRECSQGHPTQALPTSAAGRRAVANLIMPVAYNGAGDGIEMASVDGVVRRCHPIFAVFAGDYPEQVLVTATKTGECPTCPVPRDELASFEDLYEPRELAAVLDAVEADGNATEFTRACASAGIKPIYRPFWEDLPYVNIFLSITSHILHQLYQGVIKHVVA
ncbi:hypothetical protein C8R47DRAFT_1254400 [Mycena vitilis]|nr:hypothetical protein C8R47DRAFT_1254400 [Mycena vitilis]